MSKSRNSEKINIIDNSTFTQIQQHSSSTRNVQKIRNSKYRKKHQNAENDFNLFDWVTLVAANNLRKGSKSINRAHYKKGASLVHQKWHAKRGGKVREKHQKKLTRLKKSIMRNRELRHNQSHARQDIHRNDENPKNDNEGDAEFHDLQHSDIENYVDYINPLIQQTMPNVCSFAAITDEMDGMSLQEESLTKPFKPIHSRRFREYCDNCTTPELAELCNDLLNDLNRFQKRAYQKNPIKANAHRRIVVGFREVQNNLRVNKIKLVLMATDCEKCNLEGGIDDEIEAIKTECISLNVPYAFPMQRRQLAYALKKNGIISCVGIMDYDGCREKFAELIHALNSARDKYNTTFLRIK